MSYSQAQIVALERAIASGATRVSYDGKNVEYRSLAEMREVLATMKADVANSTRLRTIRITTPGDKGL